MKRWELLAGNVSRMFPVATFLVDFQNLVESIQPGAWHRIVPVAPGTTARNMVDAIVKHAILEGWARLIFDKIPRNPANVTELNLIQAELDEVTQPTINDPTMQVALTARPVPSLFSNQTDFGGFQEHYFNYTLALLSTAQDELWKNAVQDLCLMMEQGFSLSNAQREALSSALDPLWTTSSYKTRNWIVKAVGLCRLRHFRGHLQDLFLEDTTDEESKSWALAAYSRLLDVSGAISLLNKSPIVLASFEMALQFYSNEDMGRIKGSVLLKSMEENDVTAKWITFFYGYDHPASTVLSAYPPISLVSALTSHHNNSVAEHALWALHRAPKGRIEHSELSLETLHTRAPNVRRRTYLLIGKHRDSYDEHIEFLQSRIAIELDTYAREGLAQTIAPYTRFHPAMEQIIVEWFVNEHNHVVRLALLPHIVNFSTRTPSYRVLLNTLINHSKDTLLQSRCRALAERLPRRHFVNYLLSEKNRLVEPKNT